MGDHDELSARDAAYARKAEMRRQRQQNPPPPPERPSWVAPTAPNTLMPGPDYNTRQVHKDAYHKGMEHASIKQPLPQYSQPPTPAQYPPPSQYSQQRYQPPPSQFQQQYQRQPPAQHYQQPPPSQFHQASNPYYGHDFRPPPPSKFSTADEIDGSKPRRRLPQVRAHPGRSSEDHFSHGLAAPDVGEKSLGQMYHPGHAGRASLDHARDYFGGGPAEPRDALDNHMRNVRDGAPMRGGAPEMPPSSQGSMPPSSQGYAGGAAQPMRMWQQRQAIEERRAMIERPLAGEQPAYRKWQQREDARHHEQFNRAEVARGVVRAPWE